MDMGQPKPAPYQTTVAEYLLNILWMSISGYIEILGFTPQQQISYPSAYKVGLITGFLQTIQNLKRIFAYVVAGNIVLRPGNYCWSCDIAIP
jgi:hypothetical protein